MRIPHGLRAALAGQGSTPAPTTDANFENTVLLLHGDGTNGAQNNTFTDGSTNNFTITRNGNTTQGTFSPYGDNWSNYFDGTGDFLTGAATLIPTNSSTWTAECWIYMTANPTGSGNYSSPLGIDASAAGGVYMTFGVDENRYPKFFWYDGGVKECSNTTALALHAWHHIAVVVNSGTIKIFANGQDLTLSGTTTITNRVGTASGFTIGRSSASNREFSGYISNIRVVNGTAVYTSNFTPSTTPLTAITNTSLLTCQGNRFRDASTNNFTITRNGDVSVQRFSPFSPAAAYSSSTIGGSGYFDGTGDYLSVADNAALDMESSNFTIEGWYFPLGNATASTAIFSKRANNYTVGGVLVYYGSTGLTPSLLVDIGGSWTINIASSVSFVANQWNHFAVTRNGSAFNLYINGVSGVSASNAGSIPDNSSAFVIGAMGQDGSGTISSCYISNFRIVKGTAVYTAAFTPPTSPLTAITNTSLLLNFTNGGIIDNTMMNDLETVGNAQISTSVKKYGTGSLYFDGTGDWLLTPNNTQLDFGSGNFTVEYWINFNSVSGIIGVFGKRINEANYAPILMYLQSSALQLLMSTSGSSWNVSLSTSTLSTGTWYHIAVCRSGTTVYLFLNGTSVGSTGTASGALITNTAPLIVGADSTSPSGASPLNGYIDDLRITKGVARYTANFTPPTAALPDL